MDLRGVPELIVDLRKQDPQGAWARLRAGVLARLLDAQRALSADVRLLVVEGHRPLALQQKYFDEYRAQMATAHPDRGPELVDAEAGKHVCPPAVAPHPCRAAVDLTPVRNGTELDLGTGQRHSPGQRERLLHRRQQHLGDRPRQAPIPG